MERYVLVILGVIITPLIMSLLLKVPMFGFADGNVESWIGFWGSYVGALIGAATVYFVTNLQVKEQRNIQLQAIKKEHENALKRELKQFHFKNEVEKIEEFNDLIEDTMDLVLKSLNEFTGYITYTHILYGGQDEYTKEQEKEYKGEIRNFHMESLNWIHKLTKATMKMHRLSAYIEDAKLPVADITNQIESFIVELRNGYQDKYSFKKYPNFNKPALSEHIDEFSRKFLILKENVLQPKLEEKISEMKRNAHL